MGSVALPVNSHVLLDTMCFIYVVEQVPPYMAVLRPVLGGIASGEVRCSISVLALSEVLVQPLRAGDGDLVDRFRALLTRTKGVMPVAVDMEIAERAADLRARYGLRTPDAIHVATALHAGCTHILTNDRAWQRVTECAVVVLQDVINAP